MPLKFRISYVNIMISVACPGIRKGGGGKNMKGFFSAFQFFKGGSSSENSKENDISDSKSSKI